MLENEVTASLQEAEHYIIFHAAYYPTYNQTDKLGKFCDAIRENENKDVKIIFIFISNKDLEKKETSIKSNQEHWLHEFSRMLRSTDFKRKGYEQYHRQANGQIENLKDHLDTNKIKIEIIESSFLPAFPIIMIDNTLFLGFYAHSQIPTPDGLWIKIKHDEISNMYRQLELEGVKTTKGIEDNQKCSSMSEVLEGVEKPKSIKDYKKHNDTKAILRFVEEIYNCVSQNRNSTSD